MTNLKQGKNLNRDVTIICEGIYILDQLVKENKADPENIAMWIREAKELWPYALSLYGMIFS